MSLLKALLPGTPGRRWAGLRHLAAALAVVVCASGTASAGLVFTFDQSNTNSIGPDGGNYGTATIDDSTTDGTLSPGQVRFVLNINPARPADLFQEFGLNSVVALTAANFLSVPTGWSLNLVDGMDGFGSFDATLKGGGNERVATATILLGGLGAGGTIANFLQTSSGGGEGPVYVAAHLIPASGFATGYVGASAAPTAVPETASLAMGGLVTLMGLGCAWRKRKQAVA